MLVLKTASPSEIPSAPKPRPVKTAPSSRASRQIGRSRSSLIKEQDTAQQSPAAQRAARPELSMPRPARSDRRLVEPRLIGVGCTHQRRADPVHHILHVQPFAVI